MKKSFLLIPALAVLILASCGGGNGNQSQNTTDSTSFDDGRDAINRVSTDRVSTEDNAAPESPETELSETESSAPESSTESSIAYEVTELLVDKKLINITRDDLDNFDKQNLEQDPNHIVVSPGDGIMRLHCYPYKSGGYYVAVIWDVVCDCPGEYRYEYFTYKDGNVTKAKSLFPKPTINDFYSNADKFPKDVYNILKQRIAGNTYYYFYYEGNNLTASFDGFEWDGGYDVPKQFKKYYETKEASFANITYIWDGEKFVRDPQTAPYEEDLALFK